ncbi:MAG: class I SAM-dependent methyltransferase [Thermoleophilaceae bacterium]|nr:class I SAM-dependent methyltransferase [Thermoleophilaceae bacterium]
MSAIARKVALGLLTRMKGGTIRVEENGREIGTFGTAGSDLHATLRIHDPRTWRALIGGSAGAGRAYMDGAWDSDDLVTLVRIGARDMPAFDRLRERLGPALGPVQRTMWRARSNTRARTRERIASHYDLGNDFFSLWLDPTLSYSAALFPEPGATLAEAQEAKVDRAFSRLELGPDDHLLEIGTGWGYLAARAARVYGCRVTTTTVSQAQHRFATELMRREGLGDRVTVLLEDYRDLRGRYDKLISIEMIEAVGWEHLGLFMERCSDLLTRDGAMLMQAIVFPDDVYEVEKASIGFINENIFPGGTIPSLEAIGREAGERTDLRLSALEDLTPHYAETLRQWREAFAAAEADLERLGYDERFRRMWTMYLAYCEAGFLERRIRDVQALWAKPAFEGALDLPRISAWPQQHRALAVPA